MSFRSRGQKILKNSMAVIETGLSVFGGKSALTVLPLVKASKLSGAGNGGGDRLSRANLRSRLLMRSRRPSSTVIGEKISEGSRPAFSKSWRLETG